jgi:hypothetical protein
MLVDVVFLLLHTVSQAPMQSHIVDLKNDKRTFRVVSDFHGDIDSVLTIFDKVGIPSSQNPFIVIGDLLDKGEHSVELLILFCLMKQENPDAVYILKGNHELDSSSNMCKNGVYDRLCKTYNATVTPRIYGLIRMLTKRLPLVLFAHNAVIVHACCPLEDMDITNNTERLEFFMLWTDIHSGNTVLPNTVRQGNTVVVGRDLVFRAMEKLGVRFMIRGHQYTPVADVRRDGLLRIITIASSPFGDPVNHNISFATLDANKVLVHNIPPGQDIQTTEFKQNYSVFAKLQKGARVEDVQKFYGVVLVQTINCDTCKVTLNSEDIKNFFLHQKSVQAGQGIARFYEVN